MKKIKLLITDFSSDSELEFSAIDFFLRSERDGRPLGLASFITDFKMQKLANGWHMFFYKIQAEILQLQACEKIGGCPVSLSSLVSLHLHQAGTHLHLLLPLLHHLCHLLIHLHYLLLLHHQLDLNTMNYL